MESEKTNQIIMSKRTMALLTRGFSFVLLTVHTYIHTIMQAARGRTQFQILVGHNLGRLPLRAPFPFDRQHVIRQCRAKDEIFFRGSLQKGGRIIIAFQKEVLGEQGRRNGTARGARRLTDGKPREPSQAPGACQHHPSAHGIGGGRCRRIYSSLTSEHDTSRARRGTGTYTRDVKAKGEGR